MYCRNIFLLGLTSRHKAFSAGLECPGQWPWYTKDSAHKNRTQGEKRRREASAVWRKGCKTFPEGRQLSQGEWVGYRRLKKSIFFQRKVCPLSGCRLQAGGEVVLKEIPFPMWPGPGVIYRSDYHHWQGRGWESWIKYTRPAHEKTAQPPEYSFPHFCRTQV